MDILYILGKGSKHDNIELRMSLRSICKYGKNIDRVIVAGNPVDWLSDEVIKIPVPDKYGRKHLNIMNCIQTIVDMGVFKGEFLYSSDDHFYVHPVDFNNYPYWIKSKELRSKAIKGARCYGYHLSLVQTRELLMRHGFPIMNFEQHANTHMHAKVIKDFCEIIDESYKLERGSPPTSLVMNIWVTQEYGPKELVRRSDIKIREANSAEEIRNIVGTRDCFSIGDSIFTTNAITDFFNQEYPDKCRYEK